MGLERPTTRRGGNAEKDAEKKREPIVSTEGDFSPEKPSVFPEAVPEAGLDKHPSGPLRSAIDIAMERTMRPLTEEEETLKGMAVDQEEAAARMAKAEEAEDVDDKPVSGRTSPKKETPENLGKLAEKEERARNQKLPGQDQPEEWQEALGNYEPIWKGQEVVPPVPASEADEKIIDWTEVAKHDPSWKGPEIEPPAVKAKEESIDWTQVVDHDPSWQGPQHHPLERPPAPPPPTPERPRVPTPEEQARQLANLKESRERLVKSEQSGDKGGVYEGVEKSHWDLLHEYDRARAEFIDGDAERFKLEQFELMKKRAEGVPGKFEKWMENKDKLLRKEPIPYVSWKSAIGGALFGLGFAFPPAWLARYGFGALGTFITSYETMRRASLEGMKIKVPWTKFEFNPVKGIKNEMLQGLESLTAAQLEGRMAGLAAYAKIQGYWDDVKEPYGKLNDVYLEKLKAEKGEAFDVNQYAYDQVRESRDKFEEEKSTEKKRKFGRLLGAAAAGLLAGGALKWFSGSEQAPAGGKGTAGKFDAYDRQPYVPKPAPGGGGGMPTPGETAPYGETIPDRPEAIADLPDRDVAPYSNAIPDRPEAIADLPPDNDTAPYSNTISDRPEAIADLPDQSPVPSQSVFERITDYMPAEHGLRDEYWEIVKDEPTEQYLKHTMWSTDLKTQWPYPEVDKEYPWMRKNNITHMRMMDYINLQKRMQTALDVLKGDPAAFEAAKKLPVSEFLKQVMGQKVEKLVHSIR